MNHQYRITVTFGHYRGAQLHCYADTLLIAERRAAELRERYPGKGVTIREPR